DRCASLAADAHAEEPAGSGATTGAGILVFVDLELRVRRELVDGDSALDLHPDPSLAGPASETRRRLAPARLIRCALGEQVRTPICAALRSLLLDARSRPLIDLGELGLDLGVRSA